MLVLRGVYRGSIARLLVSPRTATRSALFGEEPFLCMNYVIFSVVSTFSKAGHEVCWSLQVMPPVP